VADGTPPPPAGTIRGAKLRPRHLAAQDLELVAQDQQLDVLDVQTAATPNERSQQRPGREVEKREGHGRRSSQPAHERRDTRIGAPQGANLLHHHRDLTLHQLAVNPVLYSIPAGQAVACLARVSARSDGLWGAQT
jgi:hypothetical protein